MSAATVGSGGEEPWGIGAPGRGRRQCYRRSDEKALRAFVLRSHCRLHPRMGILHQGRGGDFIPWGILT